jgi:2-dehydropantoate 2-reductase
MKFAVIGLGAVGSIIGGLLTRSNQETLLIGKETQIKELKKNGLKIKGISKKPVVVKKLNVTSDYSKLKEIDVIFICVKSQDTEELSKSISKYLKKSSVIVSLQNGVKNKQIISEITNHQCIAGIVLFNSIYLKAGSVNLTYNGGIVLEKLGESTEKISSFLTNAGFKVTLVDNILGYQYSKLIVNLQIAVTALTGQTIKESITNKYSREILVKTMNEGIEIVNKSGIKLERLPDIDPIKIVKRMQNLNKFLLALGSRFMGIKQEARNSMWQSLRRGRPTEIDYINGEIVSLAKKNNLTAPINSRLVELIKEAEENKELKKHKPEKLKEILKIK